MFMPTEIIQILRKIMVHSLSKTNVKCWFIFCRIFFITNIKKKEDVLNSSESFILITSNYLPTWLHEKKKFYQILLFQWTSNTLFEESKLPSYQQPTIAMESAQNT